MGSSMQFIRILILLLYPALALTPLDIFVFSPESKSGLIQTARVSFERFLQAEGITAQVHFFANAIDLETALPRIKPGYAIVASYYYAAQSRELQWRPLLSGHHNGDEFFHKIFMVDQSVTKVTELRDKPIATTSFGAATLSFVNQQYLQPIGLTISQVRLITVSKDVDGLMALAVGQVKAAIVTQDSIERLKTINASAFVSMKEWRKLPAIAYPKLVQFPQAQDAAKLRQVMRKMSTNNDGGDCLRYLGVTGFQ